MILLTILSLVFLLFNNSCDNIIDADITKSPHEYTWTTDTLYLAASFQIAMNSIWGSSNKNIYAVGHSASSKGVMWHYDGNKWENIKLNFVEGGPIRGPFSLSKIIGLSSSNIWAAGATLRAVSRKRRLSFTGSNRCN